MTDIASQNRPSPSWRRPETLAAIVAIVCYVNVVPNDFCFDDTLVVRDSAKVNEPGQWGAIFRTDHWSESADGSPDRDLLYRPLALSSYRFVRMLAGPGALTQHLLNITLHALLAVLVVRLALSLPVGARGACLAGLLFAALPIHANVVAAVVGRADLLATLGVIATLLAHRQVMRTEIPVLRFRWQMAGIAMAFLAIGSKESGIAAFASVLIMDALWSRDDASSRTTRTPWLSLQTALRLSYLLIPLVLYLAMRYQALGGRFHQQSPMSKTINVLVDASPAQHALGVVQLWGMYCAKTVWPAALSVKYSINGIRLATSALDPNVLVGIAATLSLIAVSVALWRRGERRIAALATILVLAYIPTSNAIVLMQVFFAERIWYLPSVFVVLIIGVLLDRKLRGTVPWVAVSVIVSAMAVRCWMRSAEWRNDGTLYAAAFEDQPDAVGPLQLYGQWLTDHDQVERGVMLLNRAIQIDLGYTDAHRALGRAYLRTGQVGEALRHLQIAEMQAPGHKSTANLLKSVSSMLSRRDDALERLRQDVVEHPDDVAIELDLVKRLRDLGLLAEALDRFAQREPAFEKVANWQGEFAVTLVMLNRLDDAIARYRTCVALAPNDPQRLVELAMLLLERRKYDDLVDARTLANRAIALAPNAPTVLLCSAEISAAAGDMNAALRLMDQAINLLPSGSNQRRLFEERAKTLGR